MLEELGAVVVFTEDTPREIIERLRPDVLAKGDEYAEAEMPGAAFIRSRGGSIVRIPMKPGLSTTAILTKSGDPRAQVQTTTETRADGRRHGPSHAALRLSSATHTLFGGRDHYECCGP